MSSDPLDEWRHAPFFILGVTPAASRSEIERAGAKLLGLLALDSAQAQIVETPLGPVKRDADLVRRALGLLRNPERRILEELWSDVEPPTGASDRTLAPEAPWREAFTAMGWRLE